MVRHVFMWRVAQGADPDRIIELLNSLPDRIPGVRSWEIGGHSGEKGESGDPWDGVLIADYDSWEDLEGYSNHPYHMEVVEQLLPMFADRALVDFERGEG